MSNANGQALVEVRAEFLEQIQDTAVQQARETIQNRVDEMGLKEAVVTAQNTDIIVEVPGADQATFDHIRADHQQDRAPRVPDRRRRGDVRQRAERPAGRHHQAHRGRVGGPEQAAGRVGATWSRRARTRARSSATTSRSSRPTARCPRTTSSWSATTIAPSRVEGKHGEPRLRARIYLFGRAEVTGQAIEDAFVATDPQTNKPYVAVNFNRDGAEAFGQLTGRNIKRRMAIVLDDHVASAPVIQTEIGGGRCQITLGGFRPYNQVLNEAKDLVIVLKAGALPVPIRPSNEQMIGPTLGRDGVEQGVKGALVSILIVLLVHGRSTTRSAA